MPNFTARDRLKFLAGGTAALLSACGGGGGSSTPPQVIVTPPPPPPPASNFVPTSGQLRDSFSSNFQVGAAVQTSQLGDGSEDAAILSGQFSSLTAEFEMKPDIIGPAEGTYNWGPADRLMEFAESNGLAVRGHALLWHLTAPDWMISGTPAEVKAKLQTYITDVVTRYRGRIYAWDVVNEVITDDNSASDPYRRSNWWTASGGNADYIDWAFEAARAADPDCQLHINDYGTEFEGKRGRLIEVVRDLRARNIPLDGLGHQMHINAGSTAQQVLDAVDDVDNQFMGLEQHITELDVSLYSDPGSCFDTQTGCQADYGVNVPDNVTRDQALLYRAIFEGLKSRTTVNSVSLWGVSDGQSWLNNFPITRTNAPLLWDNEFVAKPALQAILEPDFTP